MKEFEESNQKGEISSHEGSSLKSEKGAMALPPFTGVSQEAIKKLSKPHFFIQNDRFTCTFFMGQEAVSIHFDRLRGEIFFNGHNIRNVNLSEVQVQSLRSAGEGLLHHRQNIDLSSAYEACLQKTLSIE